MNRARHPLDPANWHPIDDLARDGACQCLRNDAGDFALARWDGARFVYPATRGLPLDFEPTAYYEPDRPRFEAFHA